MNCRMAIKQVNKFKLRNLYTRIDYRNIKDEQFDLFFVGVSAVDYGGPKH